VAYAASDETKIIDLGWPWRSLTTVRSAILATAKLLVLSSCRNTAVAVCKPPIAWYMWGFSSLPLSRLAFAVPGISLSAPAWRHNTGCACMCGQRKYTYDTHKGALNLQDWILTDQIYKWTCMMTGQESERPTKSQGQQLFTSRLQPTREEVRNVDSRDGHRTLLLIHISTAFN